MKSFWIYNITGILISGVLVATLMSYFGPRIEGYKAEMKEFCSQVQDPTWHDYKMCQRFGEK